MANLSQNGIGVIAFSCDNNFLKNNGMIIINTKRSIDKKINRNRILNYVRGI